MAKPANTKIHVLEGPVNHNIGTHETIFIEVEQSFINAELQLVRHCWPLQAETVIRAQMFISYDSGRKWHLLIGCETNGGVLEGNISSVRTKMKSQYKTHKRLLKAIITCKIPLTIETRIEVW